MANISFLVEYFPGGGVERVLMNLAQHLTDKGHTIYLFVRHLAKESLPEGLPIEYIELPYSARSSRNYDFVVDAIDTLSPKLALIKGALDRGIRLVSSMGAGAKCDPTLMEIKDIAKTHHCPLAHMLRKRLHKIGIKRGFWAVFSPEPVREGAMILCEEQNKKSNVGTISYIPALFGIGCASVVVRGLIGELDV